MDLLEELRLIDQVAERLSALHPQVSPEIVGAAVGAAHAYFDGIRFRQSVPLSVEQMATTTLIQLVS